MKREITKRDVALMVIPWDLMHNLLKNKNEPHYDEPIRIFGFENPLRHFIKYVAFNPCQMISEDLNQYFFLKMKNERIVVILILSEKIYFISQRR